MKKRFPGFMVNIARYFYALALIAYGLLQFAYSDFRYIFLPPWQSSLPGLPVWADLFGLLLIATAIAMLFNKFGREMLLLTAIVMLIFLLAVQLPYELTDPHSYSRHLGSWEGPLKELALAGGALLISKTFERRLSPGLAAFSFFRIIGKLTPLGPYFFSFTMICFGIAHFLYAAYTIDLVPRILPDRFFWVYFTGSALIAAGICIMLFPRVRIIAGLLAGMIFCWIVTVHLPGVLAHPFANRSNAIASAFDALAFTATALTIALKAPPEKMPPHYLS